MPSPMGTPADSHTYVPDNTPATTQSSPGLLDGIARLLAPLRADYVDPTATPENIAKTYQNLSDLSTSAINGLGFGAPRAVQENLDPSTVGDWKKTTGSEAGQNGTNIGTLLSSAVPIPGLGGVGLAKAGAPLVKQILGGAVNAGVNSAGQQGIRELTNAAAASPEGRDASIDGGNIVGAGLMGAGLGAIFHGIVGAVAGRKGAGSIKAAADEIAAADKLEKGQLLNINKTAPDGSQVTADPIHPAMQKAADAYVNKISGGQNGPIRDALEGQTPLNQASNIPTQTVNTAYVGNKYGIIGENTPKELAAANVAIKGNLDAIDAAAQPHIADIKTTVGSDDVLSNAMKTASQIPDNDAGTKVAQIQKQIGNVQQAMLRANSAGEMRTVLNQGLDTMSAQMQNDATLRYGYQALQGIKNSFNDSLSGIMANNPATKGLAQVPQEYGILQDIGHMSTMQQMAALQSGAGPGAVEKTVGAITQHPTTLLKTLLRPSAAKIDQSLTKTFPEAVSGVAGATAPGNAATTAATAASGGTPIQPVINAMSKKGDQNGPNATPGTLQTDLYDQSHKPTPAMVKMLSAIEDRFQTRMQGYSQMNVDGQENDFTKAARSSLASKLFDADGNPNMQALGQFMFEGGPDQEAYNKAINAYNQMMPNIREAYESSHGIGQVPIAGGIFSNTPGLSKGNVYLSNFISTMTPNQNAPKSARNAVIEGLQRFTGSPKDEWNANEAIVNSSSPNDLEKRLLGSMKSSNSIGYGLLKQIGLVP